MFGFLKKKLKEGIDKISKSVSEKEEEKIQEAVEEVRQEEHIEQPKEELIKEAEKEIEEAKPVKVPTVETKPEPVSAEPTEVVEETKTSEEAVTEHVEEVPAEEIIPEEKGELPSIESIPEPEAVEEEPILEKPLEIPVPEPSPVTAELPTEERHLEIAPSEPIHLQEPHKHVEHHIPEPVVETPLEATPETIATDIEQPISHDIEEASEKEPEAELQIEEAKDANAIEAAKEIEKIEDEKLYDQIEKVEEKLIEPAVKPQEPVVETKIEEPKQEIIETKVEEPKAVEPAKEETVPPKKKGLFSRLLKRKPKEEKPKEIEAEKLPELPQPKLEEVSPQEIAPEVHIKVEETVPEVKVEPMPQEKVEEPHIEQPKEEKSVIQKIRRKITEKKLEEGDVKDMLREFETGLLSSDVAVEASDKIISDLKGNLVGNFIKRGEIENVVKNSFKKSITEILSVPSFDLIEKVRSKKPFVIVFLGFNGVGKTTSMARIGYLLKNNGLSCVFAAADSWRAAAIEQLEEHGKNLGIGVIKHTYGADPAAVIFDAVKHAKSKGIDVVLADTAGRSHSNANLMDELKKIIKVNSPDLKILVLDSLTGNDIYDQCKLFNDAVGVDGMILTKADVYEKGGAAISASFTIKKPILYLGVGQEYEKLEKFEPEKIVSRLLE